MVSQQEFIADPNPDAGSSWMEFRAVLPEPSQVAAWFDPATGLIGHSLSRENLESHHTSEARMALLPGGASTDLNHEWAHFHQATVAPFVWLWSATWSRLVHELAAGIATDLIEGPAYTAMVSLAERSDVKARAVELLGSLTGTGEWRVSAHDIMESDAMRVEAALHVKDEDPERLWAFIHDHAPSSAYRRPYDIVRLFCGDHVAFEYFHSIALTALSCARPALAFERIVRRLALSPDVSVPLILAVAEEDVADGSKLLARPFGGSSGHQFLDPYVDAMSKWIAETGVSVEDLLVDPRLCQEMGTIPTILYGIRDDGKVELQPGYARGILDTLETPQGEAALRYKFAIAAISQHLIATHLSPLVDGAAVAGDADWLANMPAKVPAVYVDLKKLREVEVADRTKHINILATNISTTMRVDPITEELDQLPRNRIELHFSAVDGDSPWEDELARSVVARLCELLPCAPLFLADDIDGEVFMLWIGSVAPSAVEGAVVNVAHGDFVKAVDALIAQSVDAQESHDVDFRLAWESFWLPVSHRDEDVEP
jgi:hypothetical protein